MPSGSTKIVGMQYYETISEIGSLVTAVTQHAVDMGRVPTNEFREHSVDMAPGTTPIRVAVGELRGEA
jgi:hypothetical protein